MKKNNNMCICGHSREQHGKNPSDCKAIIGGSIRGGPIYCSCKQFTMLHPIEDEEMKELRQEAIEKVAQNSILGIEL